MGSLNCMTIIGNLGADPELRFTGEKIPVCNMRIATSYKSKGGQEKTEWHRVVVWKEQAENCAKYLKKGRAVYVQGRIETREYTTSAGERKESKEVVAEKVVFLPSVDPANDRPRHETKPAAREAGDDPMPDWDDV
jgi:single-strand DNA-binding protein